MTNEMQDYRPYDPPPPPPAEHAGGCYGHWSADPTWGPPTWPPSQQAPRGIRIPHGPPSRSSRSPASAPAAAPRGRSPRRQPPARPTRRNPSGSTGTGQQPRRQHLAIHRLPLGGHHRETRLLRCRHQRRRGGRRGRGRRHRDDHHLERRGAHQQPRHRRHGQHPCADRRHRHRVPGEGDRLRRK